MRTEYIFSRRISRSEIRIDFKFVTKSDANREVNELAVKETRLVFAQGNFKYENHVWTKNLSVRIICDIKICMQYHLSLFLLHLH